MLDSGVTKDSEQFDFKRFRDKTTRDITLFDGSTFQLESVEGLVSDRLLGADPLNLDRYDWAFDDNFNVIVSNPDGGNVEYLDGATWK